MNISCECPGCGKHYDLSLKMAGKRARCKQCATEFVIPAPLEAVDPPSPSTRPPSPRPEADAYAVRAEPIRPGAPSQTPADAPAAPARAPVVSEARKRPTEESRPGWLVGAVVVGGVSTLLLIGGPFLALGRKQAAVEIAPLTATVAEGAKLSAETPKAVPVVTPTPAPLAAEAPTEQPLSTASVVARYEPSVAIVQGKRGVGTGFLVRTGILVTNAHVIDGEIVQNIEVRFPSAEEKSQGPLKARLLYQDKMRDLAFLAVASNLPPLQVATSYKYRKGEDVTVIGNPGVGGQLILENAVSRGVVSSKTKINGQEYLQLGVSINPGNSGGPVFDSTGTVIGVATLKTTREEGLAFCVPASDLRAGLAIAESRAIAVTPNAGKPASVAGASRDLKYGWKTGATYVYSVDISIESGAASLSIQGSSVYRVKSVDAEGITFGHRGWLVTRKRGPDGRALPGGVSGPNVSNEIELKIDAKGNVVNAVGSSPLPLLGDLSTLVIEPLPDGPQSSWEDSQTISLNEVERIAGSGTPGLGRPGLGGLPRSPRSRLSSRLPMNPRSRLGSRFGTPAPQPPQVKVTSHPASEQTTYTLGAAVGDTAPIAKTYELTTQEMVGAEPRLKMTGEGTVTFDLKAGLPLAVDYHAKVIESTVNTTVRVPFGVSCRLLDGEERARALRPPVMPPTAMNAFTSKDVDRALADLKSGDGSRVRNGSRALYDASPIDERRGDVSRVLEKRLGDKDAGLHGEAIRALGVWGDDRSAGPLVERLNDERYGARDELFEAIGRLAPGGKAADAVVAWLAKDANRTGRAVRAIGQPAEPALLKIVEEGPDARIRSEACRLLKDVGGPQGVPVLERVARLKDGGEVGRVAGEAAKAIARRWPEDDEWASILRDAKSPDGRRRREAADRILACEPTKARRAGGARALESLAGDVDGGTQGTAIRALAAWGDPSTRLMLIERLGDPGLQPFRETVQTLERLGPDERAAVAIAGWLKKDRGLVLEALAAMGSAGEKAAIGLLRDKSEPWDSRNQVCGLLGRIGTKASLPALGDVVRANENGIVVGSAQRAVKEIEARGEGDEWLSAALGDLKSSDHNRVKQAVELISNHSPGNSRRPEVARALEALLDDQDVFMKQALMNAAGLWGDDRTAEALAVRLVNKELRDWGDALQALVKLKPDSRAAGLAVRRLTQDGRLATMILQAIGAESETALLSAANSGAELRDRVEACRALGGVGSPKAIPTPQVLAQKAGDDQLAGDAEDALKAIASRQ
jgi:S1-C subfamily serine protease/HEAT repeat protein